MIFETKKLGNDLKILLNVNYQIEKCNIYKNIFLKTFTKKNFYQKVPV